MNEESKWVDRAGRLEEIRRRHAFATRGPWILDQDWLTVLGGENTSHTRPGERDRLFSLIGKVLPVSFEKNADGSFKVAWNEKTRSRDVVPVHDDQTRADAQFIAHSWEDVGFMLELLDEVMEERK